MDKLIVVVFLASFMSCSTADNDHGSFSVSFDKESFNEVVNEKPLFVMFFAPWCGHCKRLAPTWDDLAKEVNVEGGEVTVGKVDCTQHTELCSDHGVRGYPTLKLFNKNTEGDKFSGKRTIENLKAFMEEKLSSGEPKPKQEEDKKPEVVKEKAVAENGLYELTKDNFDDHITKGHHFVKFYAPWCGHCNRLAPTWKELAEKTKDDGKATIAKVDCTKHTSVCTRYSVRGYPTLLWFTDGQKSEEYNGGRDIGSLSGFVEKMTSPESEKKKTSVDGKVPDSTAPKQEPEVENGLYTLTDDTFESHVSTGYHFVKFYAPWCGHCKRLAPTWSDLAKEMEAESDVKIAKVDCTSNRKICGKNSVSGYPTLLFFYEGENKGAYRGARDLDSLKGYVENMLKELGAKQEKEEEAAEKKKEDLEFGVVLLTDEDFKEAIADDLTFIMFADDKCESCKEISKVLEELADAFNEPELMIAVVNCGENKQICDTENVKDNLPKLRLYNNGKFVGLYTGEKTFSAMKSYLSHQLKNLAGHGGEL